MDSGLITMVFDIFLLVVILIFGRGVDVTALVFSMSLASDTGFLKHIKRRLETFCSSLLIYITIVIFCFALVMAVYRICFLMLGLIPFCSKRNTTLSNSDPWESHVVIA